MKEFLKNVKAGDTVRRMLAGKIPMDLVVEKVEGGKIYTLLGYDFDQATGAEIDDYLGWGPDTVTGSFLVEIGE